MRFLLLSIQRIKPERFFILFALLFGLTILLLTPPFQSPDEINHFYRAYQISEGKLKSARHDNRIGGFLPESLTEIVVPFSGMPWNMHVKTSYNTIKQQFKTPLDPDRRIFVDFPNTGMYSPISYLPQALSIFVLRKCNLPPLYIFYGARLFTLFFWIFSIFFVIKAMPFFKWFFTLIALLPMSLFVNMSISADVVTNLLSFTFIAYVLKSACSDHTVYLKTSITMLLLAVLLASAKLVYSPLVMLFLLIPKDKFSSRKSYYTQLIILFTATLATLLYWSKVMNDLYLPYSMYNEEFRDSVPIISCADMHQQVQYIISHGFYILKVFAHSMVHAFDMYFRGYIGTFGWLDTKLPGWLIWLSYGVLFLIALTDHEATIRINRSQKLIILSSLIAIICLILLSQHLTWDCVGGDVIVTLQGRYFIPAFPLLFMLLYNSRLNNPRIIKPIVIIYLFICLSVTVQTLYTRYYVKPSFESAEIRCNAESITRENLYITDNPKVFFENGSTQSDTRSRSGNYSARLTPQNQFGYTYRMYNCRIGDIIDVEVWRYGKEGSVIISGGPGIFYISEDDPVEHDCIGWERIHLELTVFRNMVNKEVGIYIYNDGRDTSYFDDMAISYKKFK